MLIINMPFVNANGAITSGLDVAATATVPNQGLLGRQFRAGAMGFTVAG